MYVLFKRVVVISKVGAYEKLIIRTAANWKPNKICIVDAVSSDIKHKTGIGVKK